MTDRPQETLVSVAGLRAICGAKPNEIEQLIRARQITARDGKVSLVAGVRAYLDAIRAATKSASLASAQDASRAARADAAELALAVDARSMIPVDEVDGVIADLCGAIMARTFTIPARVTRDVRDRRKIEDTVRRMQQKVANDVAALADDPEPKKRKAKP